MNSPVEIFDVVDEQDRVIDRAPRHLVHARGWRHRAVHVWLFNPAGELFIQQRAATKDTFPGCYDSSASGHLEAGEDYDHGACRELEEELGLTVTLAALTRHFKIDAGPDTGWEFVWVYSLTSAQRPTINREEITAGEFVSLAEIGRRIAAQPAHFARSFVRIFSEARRQRLAGRGTGISSFVQ